MPDPLNAVVDISHHNGNIDLQQAKGVGIIGVIHKATQGATGLDPMYVTNRGKAQTAGLLWGAYHFATGGDGVEQAQHFLDTVGNFQTRCSCSTSNLTQVVQACRSKMRARLLLT